MTLNHYITEDYENKSDLLTMEKQTQTNPISKGRRAFGFADFLFDFVAQSRYFYAQLF